MARNLAIVGAFGGTHIGGSLVRAAKALGLGVQQFDRQRAAGTRVGQALSWRLGDRRPLRMSGFGTELISQCRNASIEVLIATGMAPLDRNILETLRQFGIVTINFSTDDPWNPTLLAQWHLRALPSYDIVFTPRRANIEDLRGLGCRNVHRLPFGYDETLFTPPEDVAVDTGPDVLFVGGADRDRFAFMAAFMENGLRPALVGRYWDKDPATRPLALGVKSPEELRRMTAAAKVNLCIVRRANRDGHVMRSFEIAALGGCMLAEDTDEHREIFGADDESVVYFNSPAAAAARARELIADPSRRRRLAASIRRRIVGGRNTYRDRLAEMMKAVDALKAGRPVDTARVSPPWR